MALQGLLPGSDMTAEPVMLHNGMLVAPMGELVYLHDRLRLHPYVLGGGGYDSNPVQRANSPVDDQFYEWAVGCLAKLESGTHTGSLTAALFQRRYQEVSGRDLTGGALDARYGYQGQTISLRTRAKWDRSNDPTVEIGRSLERDLLLASVLASRTGNFTRGESELRLSATNYLEGTEQFSESERDQMVGEWRFAAIRSGEDKSIVGVHLAALNGHYFDAATPYHDHYGGRIAGRGRYPFGEQLHIEYGLGLEIRRYEAPYRNDPAYDDETALAPIGDAGILWTFSQTGSLRIGVASRLADSITSNYARDTAVEGDLTKQVHPRCILSLQTAWSEYRDASGGLNPAQRAQEVRVGGNAALFLYPGITANLRLLWREYTPDPGASYQQTVAAAVIVVAL